MRARRTGTCGCVKEGKREHHNIAPGDYIFYYPKTKTAYVGECADAAERDFTSLVADEDFMNQGYS
jgi:hypothetical protein